jgi:hypothetical protein
MAMAKASAKVWVQVSEAMGAGLAVCEIALDGEGEGDVLGDADVQVGTCRPRFYC